MNAEITNPALLEEERNLIVVMKVPRSKRRLPRAKFHASTLRAASIAVQHEVEAQRYSMAECVGAVVFDGSAWPDTVAWVDRDGRVYSEEPREWRSWLE